MAAARRRRLSHGALFAPPVPGRIDTCLNDLCAFAEVEELGPIAKATLAHAPELIAILDEISSMAGIRHLVAGV
ncbi:hypothetical protein AALA69_01605 [Eggerthellaceae bacterium 24-137]